MKNAIWVLLMLLCLMAGCSHAQLMVGCKTVGAVGDQPIFSDCKKL